MKTINNGYDFGAQARRKEHNLVNVSLTDERTKDLAPLLLQYRRALKKLEGGVLVVNAHGNEGHVTPRGWR